MDRVKTPLKALQNFDAKQFLREYWQQRPLLIRNAMSSLEQLLSADELAGLACEEQVESRLVNFSDGRWQLRHGPFAENDFRTQPGTDWTLLVQAVDHYVPAVAELFDYFRFLPNWRIDDIMVSYAAKGGSVGPHFDNYDVFLLQGAGQRSWRIGQRCNEKSELLNHPDLRLLKQFDQTTEWLLEPGDMLYLPPKLAHWGIAQSDDCMTYSIGLRAPSYNEVLAHFCEEIIATGSEQYRYADPQIQEATECGVISPAVIDQLVDDIMLQLNNRQALITSFGQLMTTPKYAADDEANETNATDIIAILDSVETLFREPAARLAYYVNDDTVTLFANGANYRCAGLAALLAKLFCNETHYSSHILRSAMDDESAAELIATLFNQDCFYWIDDDN